MSSQPITVFSKQQIGFSLLELLVTISILGILIAISYPNYTHYVLKTRRQHATVSLMNFAVSLEKYRSIHQTYMGASLDNLERDAYSKNEYYQIELRTVSQDTYSLLAIPKGSQVADQSCGTLGLNQAGEKSISGNGMLNNCW